MKRTLIFVTLLSVCVAAHAQDYSETLREIRQAFDHNRHQALYQRYWKAYRQKPTARSAFAAGTIRFMWLQFNSLGYKKVLPKASEKDSEYSALHYAVEHEKKSGYPLAMYVWYIGVNGEPGLPPPPRKFVRMTEIKDSSGKVMSKVPLYARSSHYPALEKRQKELIDRAFQMEPKNPLVIVGRTKPPLRDNKLDAKVVSILAELLPQARDTIWEFSLLHGLWMSRADGNKGVPADLDRWIADALDRSKNGPLSKIYGFLKKG